MSKSIFHKTVRRAFAESLEAVRWNKPVSVVIAIISVIAAVVVSWLATGSIAISALASFGAVVFVAIILFLVKLWTVPFAVAKEAVETAALIEARLVEALKEQRDPDGIYQHEKRVGTVIRPLIILGQSKATFDQIRGAENFDTSAPFQYREWELKFDTMQIDGTIYISGVLHRNLTGVVATIAGAR